MADQETQKTKDLGDAEPLQLSKDKRTNDAEMDITPLIDIVFLLLIFFLVSSKMDESAAVKLPPARHGIDVAQENAIIVLIKEDDGGGIVVLRRDGSAFSNDLAQQETEIGDYIEAGLAGTDPFDAPKDTIIVKAQGKVKEGEVARVAEAIGKATEIPSLHYAVIHEQ